MNSADRGIRTGVLVPCLMLVVLVVADIIASPAVSLSVLYAIAPLAACAVLPAATTATFAVAAFVLAALSHVWNGQWGIPQMWVRMLDVALVSAAAVAIAAVRVRREERLARVERIAEVAQRTILPRIPARVGTVSAAARYLSAAEDTLVGGDFYDWFHSERRMCFLVGDVRGKGVGAVEQAARVIRAFRQSAAAGEDLPTIAGQMSAYLVPFFDEEEFATATLVEVGNNGQVTLVDCGHPAPLLVPQRGPARFVEAPVCLPLGLGTTYEGATVSWASGDRLLLYTDGLSEARDSHDDYLLVSELTPVLGERPIEDALDAVLDQVRGHVPNGRLADDLAVLLLENTGIERDRGDVRDRLALEAASRHVEAAR
jgi:serine phosphatase RsbU (regulator of sigma subunit)